MPVPLLTGTIRPDYNLPRPWAMHVYGPAIRWNSEHPDKTIPVYIIHDPSVAYYRFFLCDGVRGTWDFIDTSDDPVPIGVGGKVVAAGFTNISFMYSTRTSAAWNWRDGMPPWVEYSRSTSKDSVFRKALRLYLRNEEF